MNEVSSGNIPCLDALEATSVNDRPVHLKRLGDSTVSTSTIVLLLLYDIRNVLSEPNVSEQAALSRLNKLQKRFFTFEELGLAAAECAVTHTKSKSERPDAVMKQIKTATKANGLWFVTVDAAMKLVFKFCTPQDAIRISLDLSPFLVGTHSS